jgi:hypothetical protein
MSRVHSENRAHNPRSEGRLLWRLPHWGHTMRSYYEVLLWGPTMRSYYEVLLWGPTMRSYYEVLLWGPTMRSYYEVILWGPIMRSYYEVLLWGPTMRSYYEFIPVWRGTIKLSWSHVFLYCHLAGSMFHPQMAEDLALTKHSLANHHDLLSPSGKRRNYLKLLYIQIFEWSTLSVASSAGLSMGFSLRMGFEKKIYFFSPPDSSVRCLRRRLRYPAENTLTCNVPNQLGLSGLAIGCGPGAGKLGGITFLWGGRTCGGGLWGRLSGGGHDY